MERNNPMVCINCKTYNHAPYIEDAMNGFCMQQTVFPYVAVIVDDASTDGEPEVIKSYLNDHFDMQQARQWETDDAHFIEAQHKENKNCTFAVVLLKYNFWQAKKDKGPLIAEWNETVKYIALCEGDDYWTDKSKLEKQKEILERHPECSFCVSDYLEYSEYKKNMVPHQLQINRNIEGGCIFLTLQDYVTRGFFTKTLTVLYKKEILTQSKYSQYESQYDMPMFYALLTQGKCAFLNEITGVYRLSDSGITSPVNRSGFVNYQLPRLFSIIRVEKTKEAQLFVYNFMERFIIRVLFNRQYYIVGKCLTHLSLSQNIKLFFCELPKQIATILKGKIDNILRLQ